MLEEICFFFRSVAKQRTYFTLKVIDKHREQEKDKKSRSQPLKNFHRIAHAYLLLVILFFVS